MELITNEKLDELLAASPAERVTPEYMKSRITSTDFTRIGETVTHCRIVLDNGFSVSGESACVNVGNYNQQIGEKIAYDNAFRQLWPLFGFLLGREEQAEGGGMKHELGDAPIQDEYLAEINGLVRGIDEIFNGDLEGMIGRRDSCFWSFPLGKQGRCNFISNGVNREHIVCMFKEMIARFQGQSEARGTA